MQSETAMYYKIQMQEVGTDTGDLTHGSAHDIHYVVQNALLNAQIHYDLPDMRYINRRTTFKPVLTANLVSNERLREYWFPRNDVRMFIRSGHLPGLTLSFLKQSFRNSHNIASGQPCFETIVLCIR